MDLLTIRSKDLYFESDLMQVTSVDDNKVHVRVNRQGRMFDRDIPFADFSPKHRQSNLFAMISPGETIRRGNGYCYRDTTS